MDDITPDSIRSLAPARLYSLDGKVAVVTGAAGGIGRWLCAGLGAAGARVLLTDVDESGLEHTAAILHSGGVVAETITVDLADDDAPARIVEAAVSRFEGLDVLVNNAGMNKRMPILEMDTGTYEHIMAIDLRAPYFLSQAAVRVMKEYGAGSIINISSINALYGLEHVSVYGQAKGGLSQLTRVQAVEWAPFGIRSNAIAPGFMDTPLAPPTLIKEIHRWFYKRVPMKRWGRPDELVGLGLLLASDAGSFLTGQTFVADGGFLAGEKWLAPDD